MTLILHTLGSFKSRTISNDVSLVPTVTVSADYVTCSMILDPFNSETRIQCFDVTIMDDPNPERDEVFFIDFVPTSDRISIIPPRISVTIQDNDCKLK